MDAKVKKQKQHQQKHSGPKAERKKLKKQGGSTEEDDRKRNPKAFAVQSAVRMAKTFHRSVPSVCQMDMVNSDSIGYYVHNKWAKINSCKIVLWITVKLLTVHCQCAFKRKLHWNVSCAHSTLRKQNVINASDTSQKQAKYIKHTHAKSRRHLSVWLVLAEVHVADLWSKDFCNFTFLNFWNCLAD